MKDVRRVTPTVVSAMSAEKGNPQRGGGDPRPTSAGFNGSHDGEKKKKQSEL